MRTAIATPAQIATAMAMVMGTALPKPVQIATETVTAMP
jgi:hypothetical protein